MAPPPVQLAAVARPKEVANDVPVLRLVPEPASATPPVAGPMFRRPAYIRRRKLGELLIEDGVVGPADMARALLAQQRRGCRLGDALVAEGLIDPDDLARALGRQYGMGTAGPAPVDCAAADALARKLPAATCLAHRAIPWHRVGDTVLIATSDPARLEALEKELPPEIRHCRYATVPDRVLHDRIGIVHGEALARDAECRVPSAMSCRSLRDRFGAALLALPVLAMVGVAAAAPAQTVRVLTVLAL
ncbi:MAG: hypothetical protein AAF264_08450, partial [Pseudomonadota bacterium]